MYSLGLLCLVSLGQKIRNHPVHAPEPGGKRGNRSEAQWVPVGMPQGKALREKGPTISLRDQPSPAVGSSRASKRTGTQAEVKLQKSCRTRWLRASRLQSKPSRAGLAATHWILVFPKTLAVLQLGNGRHGHEKEVSHPVYSFIYYLCMCMFASVYGGRRSRSGHPS